jgi:hypothetical protein
VETAGPDVRGQPGARIGAGRQSGPQASRADPVCNASRFRAASVRGVRSEGSGTFVPEVPGEHAPQGVQARRSPHPTVLPAPAPAQEFGGHWGDQGWTKFPRRPVESGVNSGRGAAWLARLTGGQEVGSSNLPGPTRVNGFTAVNLADRSTGKLGSGRILAGRGGSRSKLRKRSSRCEPMWQMRWEARSSASSPTTGGSELVGAGSRNTSSSERNPDSQLFCH